MSAPAPYRNPFLARLANRDDIEMKVIFLSKVCGEFNWHTDPVCEYPHEYIEIPDFLKIKNYPQWVPSKLRRLLREEKFDVIVLNGYFLASHIYTAFWCMANRVPFLFWVESHNRGVIKTLPRRIVHRLFISPLLRRAAGHFAVGSYAKERIVSCEIPAERVSIILNSPDVEKWISKTDEERSRRDEIRKELGLGPGPVLLFVGRMAPEKGVEELIEAFARLSQGGRDDLQLLMVGEGPLLERLKSRCELENIRGVKFLGFVVPENLYPVYSAADAFVLPSRYEPFGVVAQEAAASGLPLVLSDCCGSAAELIIEGKNGYTYNKSGGADELCKAIEKLCVNRDSWVEMGKYSRGIAKQYDYASGEEAFIASIKKIMDMKE